MEWPVYTSTSPSIHCDDPRNSLSNQKITKLVTKVSPACPMENPICCPDFGKKILSNLGLFSLQNCYQGLIL
jgi:hypothetical protein